MLSLAHVTHPLSAPFRISRGVRTATEVVVATIRRDGFSGRGESLPYARYGESVASVIEEASTLAQAVAGGMDRRELLELLPPGAARNAIDCALWDLESRQRGLSVAAMLGQPEPLPPLVSAQTVSLDTPERMERAARALSHLGLVKIKVDAGNPAAQIRAVRSALPDARLIVDPNESWTLELLREMQPVLAEARIDLVEQPLPAGQDDCLLGFASVARLCADESCHTEDDLPRLAGTYDMINIKLDKAGGLTAACRLADAARTQGFEIMVGCMVATSLSMAPATMLAGRAVFIDLDGPLWLARDRDAALVCEHGRIFPPTPQLWGWSD